jgi:hypothetical protein
VSNTSATGGPLLVASDSPTVLEGTALLDFLKGWFVGITGMAAANVRAYWLGAPAGIPQTGTCFAAIGVHTRNSDTFPYVMHNGAGNGGQGEDVLIRRQKLDLLVSFYDNGVTGEADMFAGILRDATAIRQNLELLTLNGFAFVKCFPQTVLPSILKERWLYRCDIPITLRRTIVRTYPVLNAAQAQVEFFNAPAQNPQGIPAVIEQGFIGPPVDN